MILLTPIPSDEIPVVRSREATARGHASRARQMFGRVQRNVNTALSMACRVGAAVVLFGSAAAMLSGRATAAEPGPSLPYRAERLADPARTVVSDEHGDW